MTVLWKPWFAGAVFCCAAFSADLSSRCTSATFKGLGPEGMTITSATLYPAGSQISTGGGSTGGIPGGGAPPSGAGPGGGTTPGGAGSGGGSATTAPYAICEVKGVIPAANNFALSFPADSDNWNGKYVGLGGAGTAGSVNEGATISNAVNGYAASSTDQGHSGNGDYTWEENTDLLIDFGYRANHLTAVAAKALLRAFFGYDVSYSYFNGCSGGGGAAMSMATRYPQDFNGILAGAAASNPTRMWPYELSVATWTYNDKTSTWPDDYVNKMAMITKAVTAACDALDGIADGLIDDPARCNFDPAVLQCKTVTSSSHSDTSCLTPEQVEVVRKIYNGLRDPYSGAQLFPGFARGSESGWANHIQQASASDYIPYAVLRDPAQFDWHDFLLTNPFYYWAFYSGDGRLAPILDSMNPDLSALKVAGTKVILYHGWNDANISPGNSIDYYEDVLAEMSHQGDVKDYARLFLVPGMGHCGGNSGYNSFEMFAPLVQWVENGLPPDQVVGKNAAGNTRPLCPYPEVARPHYTVSGGPANSYDYSCVPPVTLKLDPATVNAKAHSVVTASLSVPRGYKIAEWSLQNFTMNGAAPVATSAAGGTVVAVFRTDDLGTLATGASVPLTVKFTLTHNAKTVYSQATASVTVE